MWRVRAEIIGEFVVSDDFATFEEAAAVYDSYREKGYWDNVDIWKLGEEG